MGRHTEKHLREIFQRIGYIETGWRRDGTVEQSNLIVVQISHLGSDCFISKHEHINQS
jgi:hypothetical protein